MEFVTPSIRQQEIMRNTPNTKKMFCTNYKRKVFFRVTKKVPAYRQTLASHALERTDHFAESSGEMNPKARLPLNSHHQPQAVTSNYYCQAHANMHTVTFQLQ